MRSWTDCRMLWRARSESILVLQDTVIAGLMYLVRKTYEYLERVKDLVD